VWAAFSAEVTAEHRERGWRRYLTTCEARQGIYQVPIPDKILPYQHLQRPSGRAPITWISSTMQSPPRYGI
jgi:hypothetical protein